MINVEKILIYQKQLVADWHEKLEATETILPWKYIEENHFYNFSLWHEEDVARIKNIDDARIVLAKRNIDRFNQNRNNAMERIDEWVLNFTEKNGQAGADAMMHSETPGMMIDRLSIMALKRYHMQEEVDRIDASPDHIAKCAGKVAVLDEQIKDLANTLKRILSELETGTLKFKVYRQFKMYNDPSLNPELYKRQQQSVE
ncbi:DUF4254 domain-containing protein [Neolewinella agarilytica]|uniref:DUF4254 domain-containing protein n=1 Tax=Neolewinella agarilytica TaxID=478744 RepID=A0A1H9GN10_9BACT|nr:DUF4254 domain-containing protein [Neolewinella agarilytica]SEQ51383.1 Protein of unknown function [Neolewinella agarilytica]